MNSKIADVPPAYASSMQPKYVSYPYLRLANKAMTVGNTEVQAGTFYVKIGDDAWVTPTLTFIPAKLIQGERVREKYDLQRQSNQIFCFSADAQNGNPREVVYDKSKHRYISTAKQDDNNKPIQLSCKACQYNKQLGQGGDCQWRFKWLIYVPALDQCVIWQSKPAHAKAYFEFRDAVHEELKSQGLTWNPLVTKLTITSEAKTVPVPHFAPVFSFEAYITPEEQAKVTQMIGVAQTSTDQNTTDTDIANTNDDEDIPA